MSRKALLVIAAISIIIAIGAGLYAQHSFERLVTVAEFPVAARDIPPYTLITSDMIEVKELPRSLAKENIYVRPADLQGKLTTLRIPAGAIIYHPFAVPPAQFRYVDDPQQTIISFPVEPEKAVGGQVKIGHRIDIWRIANSAGGQAESPAYAIRVHGAETERLATGVLVVDVRSDKGERAGVTASGGPNTRVENADTRQEKTVPLTILTVAVSPDEAEALTRLMGELSGKYDLWVSLSAPAELEEKLARQNGQFVTAAPTNTPLPQPIARSALPTGTPPSAPTLANPTPASTLPPVPTLANPTPTNTPPPVPTLANPTDTPAPTATVPPTPTLSPTPTPTATPMWDYLVEYGAAQDMGYEGPSYISGQVKGMDGAPRVGFPLNLAWPEGGTAILSDDAGGFEFVVGPGDYTLTSPDADLSSNVLSISAGKKARRLTVTVSQVR